MFSKDIPLSPFSFFCKAGYEKRGPKWFESPVVWRQSSSPPSLPAPAARHASHQTDCPRAAVRSDRLGAERVPVKRSPSAVERVSHSGTSNMCQCPHDQRTGHSRVHDSDPLAAQPIGARNRRCNDWSSHTSIGKETKRFDASILLLSGKNSSQVPDSFPKKKNDRRTESCPAVGWGP